MASYTTNPIQLLPVTDFTGGLNYRADAFQLQGSESPDMLNMDLDPRGGVSMRDGVVPLNSSALTGTPKNIWQYATSAGVQQVLVHNTTTTSNQFAVSTGTNFTAVTPDALACTGVMRATTFKELNFIQRYAQQVPVKWDGTTATVFPAFAFNDNFASPTGLNMPKAKCTTSYNGSVWVANTVEPIDGTCKNRVRWSHPNQPMDFRTKDYIDIDVGHDGDEITALVPFGDRLLVFKSNSMYAIYGYDAATYSVQTVTHAVGAVSQEAVAVTEHGVYFFAWPEGIMLYDGSGVSWAFERIWPAISDGRILAAYQSGIAVGWLNRRLWVSVPWVSGTTNSRTFVLDPSLARRRRYGSLLGREGGWTAYDLPLGPMVEWQPPGTASTFLACHANAARVLKLHQSVVTDDLGSGAVPISSYYTTKWLDADQPAVIKRWKRPEIILRSTTAAGIANVSVAHDFDSSIIVRTLQLPLTASAGNPLVWDTGAHASNMVYDTTTWAADSPTGEVIQRLGVLGRARAVQLTFTGPTSPTIDWTIDAITLKYIPRRVRA